MENNVGQQKTVCIVDDDSDVRDIYRIKFQNEGFAVVTANDGEEGLRVVKASRPDVILLDIQMPVLDGLGMLKMLKADREFAKIPVVILSNLDSDEIFKQVSDLGAAEYYLIKSLSDPQKVIDITLQALVDNETS